jgi:hypothetical protein
MRVGSLSELLQELGAHKRYLLPEEDPPLTEQLSKLCDGPPLRIWSITGYVPVVPDRTLGHGEIIADG